MNRVLFSRKSTHWSTPGDARDKLYEEFGLDYDPCPLFSEVDGLARSWAGTRVFCKPPYNRISDFLSKAGEPEIAVYLLPSRTGTKWFHDIVLPYAKEIRFLRGRLKFGGSHTNAPFDSVVVVFHKTK